MNEAVGAALDALGDPVRRELYERILARPQAIGALAAEVAATWPSISRHLQVLTSAGLVRDEGGVFVAALDPLPRLRVYFDRLWFEASVGEGWLRERFAAQQGLQAVDAPPAAPRALAG